MSDKTAETFRALMETTFDLAPQAPGLPPVAQPRRYFTSVGVFALSFAAVLVIVGLGTTVLMQSGSVTRDAEAGSSPSTIAATTLPTSEALVQPPVLADITPPEGATWVCPAVGHEDDQMLTAAETPEALRYLPTGQIDHAWAVDYGPACNRPPALVAVDFADDQRSAVDAVVVVWVESQTAEPFAPLATDTTLSCFTDTSGTEAYCFDEAPTARELADLSASLSTELRPTETPRAPGTYIEDGGFVIRQHNQQIEMVGVIDGLPVWIEASGLGIADLQALAGQMTADAITGQVELAQSTETVEVVHSAPVVAETIQHVVWYAEGPETAIEVHTQPGFNVYTAAAIGVEYFGFPTVNGSPGFYVGEDTGMIALTWEVSPGIVARLEGSRAAVEELTRIAESVTAVSMDETDFPPTPEFLPSSEGDDEAAFEVTTLPVGFAESEFDASSPDRPPIPGGTSGIVQRWAFIRGDNADEPEWGIIRVRVISSLFVADDWVAAYEDTSDEETDERIYRYETTSVAGTTNALIQIPIGGDDGRFVLRFGVDDYQIMITGSGDVTEAELRVVANGIIRP